MPTMAFVEELFSAYDALTSLFFTSLCLVLVYILWPALLYATSQDTIVDEERLSDKQANGANDPDSSNSNILLSIIIPAYNEETRLGGMLEAAVEFLKKNEANVVKQCRSVTSSKSDSSMIEFIIVSDGSTDKTAQVARYYAAKHNKKSTYAWRLLSLRHNSGKGAAVKTGMLRARGQLLLMVDADGATDFGVGLERVLENMKSGNFDAAFGSRAHLEQESTAKRSLVRTFLMKAFHFFVKLLCSSQVHDTQCGFKLFTRNAALLLFNNLHLSRWAFDTEIVMLADTIGVRIAEVNVPWHEVDGSKLDTGKLALALVSISMLRDMLCVRLCYTLRIWKVKRKVKSS